MKIINLSLTAAIPYFSSTPFNTSAEVIFTVSRGLDDSSTGTSPIARTTFIPSCTLPKTVCFPSKCGVGANVMKNWDRFVFGPARKWKMGCIVQNLHQPHTFNPNNSTSYQNLPWKGSLRQCVSALDEFRPQKGLHRC